MISRDLVYIGPSANQVRAADLEPELVFGLGLNDDLANQESDQTRVHDMAKVHLDIYKGKIYVTFSSLSVGIVCLSALAPACLVCPCPCLSCLVLSVCLSDCLSRKQTEAEFTDQVHLQPKLGR
jgi:hypothetical protein